jgi:hypothetical protein
MHAGQNVIATNHNPPRHKGRQVAGIPFGVWPIGMPHWFAGFCLMAGTGWPARDRPTTSGHIFITHMVRDLQSARLQWSVGAMISACGAINCSLPSNRGNTGAPPL